jgi:hypothetical protein
VEQSKEQLTELRELAASPNTPPDVAARARMVLLRRRGLTRGEVPRSAACPCKPSTAGWPGSPSTALPDSPAGHGPAPRFPNMPGPTP